VGAAGRLAALRGERPPKLQDAAPIREQSASPGTRAPPSSPELMSLSTSPRSGVPQEPPPQVQKTNHGSSSSSRNHPNHTATVERDVAAAFKKFAESHRKNKILKEEASKSEKSSLKREAVKSEFQSFSENFQLTTPIPGDLIDIVTKDEIKRRKLREETERLGFNWGNFKYPSSANQKRNVSTVPQGTGFVNTSNTVMADAGTELPKELILPESNHWMQESDIGGKVLARPVATQSFTNIQMPVLAMVTMQLEFYFSIDNLCKDMHLRKHMDGQGFVLLTFIAGFKGVQALTQEFEILKFACHQSELIEFVKGEDGFDRLRRDNGWEKWILIPEERDQSCRHNGPALYQRYSKAIYMGPSTADRRADHVLSQKVESSALTVTNTHQSKTSGDPSSTLLTSLHTDQSSKSQRHYETQERQSGMLRMAAIEEGVDLKAMKNYVDDSQSTSTALTRLDPAQNKAIVKRFTKTLMENIDPELISHPFRNLGVTFQQQFQALMKNYSEPLKDEAPSYTCRQAAKRVRFLRRDISAHFVQDIEFKDQRAYPNIIKQAEAFNPPEKLWPEKVADWQDFTDTNSVENPEDSIFQIDQIIHDDSIDLPHAFTFDPISVPSRAAASQPASFADFNFSNSSSTSDLDDIQYPNPGDDQLVHDFLTSHGAFYQLITDLQELLERETCNTLKRICDCVSIGLRRTIEDPVSKPQCQSAMFCFNWDIPKFLEEHYPSGLAQDLGSVITITGHAGKAYITTVRDYLQHTWPRYPLDLLGILEGAVKDYAQVDSAGCKLYKGCLNSPPS